MLPRVILCTHSNGGNSQPDGQEVGSEFRHLPEERWPSYEPLPLESTPIDGRIITALAEPPFLSVRALSRGTCLPRYTMHPHSIQSCRSSIRHLRSLPRFLTVEQKQMRAGISRELLRILSTQMMHHWHHIVAFDESRFDRRSNRDFLWMNPSELATDRERRTIQSPKLRQTVVRNSSGFHVLKALLT
jgi:hypothetical protein